MIDFSRRIRLHREATVDITTAFEWYEARESGLGVRFLRALIATILTSHQSPERYPLIEDGMRRAMVRGFPYHVIFMADEAETLVIAVAHHRQDPAAWTKRTLRPRG